MEESATEGLKSLGLNDRDAAIRKPCCVREISVEGFETCSLQKYALKLALRKHFASCGKILYVSVIKSVAFMRIEGEDAEDKALALNGTDVGGWYAIVKAAPRQREPFVALFILLPNPNGGGLIKGSNSNNQIFTRMFVKGYDIGLPKIDIQIALCKHFSSCGEVTDVVVLPSFSSVTIKGEGCLEKALELSGRDVGGMNLVVEPDLPRPENVKRKRASCNSTGYMPPPHLFEIYKKKHEIMMAKMEKDKMEKKKMDKDKDKDKDKMKIRRRTRTNCCNVIRDISVEGFETCSLPKGSASGGSDGEDSTDSSDAERTGFGFGVRMFTVAAIAASSSLWI